MTYPAKLYPDMPMADYVADPCPVPSLNSGAIHRLVTQSPLHCWFHHPRLNPKWESEDSTETDIGKIAHAMLLEGDESKLVIVDAPDWRTKAAKEGRDQARADGKIPVLAERMEDVRAMVVKARAAIERSELPKEFMADARVEQTLLWQEDGTWFRSRPDKHGLGFVLDYKTTSLSANPESWIRGPMIQRGYDIQAALGIRGFSRFGIDCKFVFMVQETSAPYSCSFVGMSPARVELANQKIDRAIHLWRECLSKNQWPDYPRVIHWAEPAPWEQAQWEEKMWQAYELDEIQLKEGIQA